MWKEDVKYTRNDLYRAAVDVDRDVGTVATLDGEDPKGRLRNAVVTTLPPQRPQGGGSLPGDVRDHGGKPIRLSGGPNGSPPTCRQPG
jgi:Membrane-bound lytic murein transglycosylase C, N-terminal domain